MYWAIDQQLVIFWKKSVTWVRTRFVVWTNALVNSWKDFWCQKNLTNRRRFCCCFRIYLFRMRIESWRGSPVNISDGHRTLQGSDWALDQITELPPFFFLISLCLHQEMLCNAIRAVSVEFISTFLVGNILRLFRSLCCSTTSAHFLKTIFNFLKKLIEFRKILITFSCFFRIYIIWTFPRQFSAPGEQEDKGGGNDMQISSRLG